MVALVMTEIFNFTTIEKKRVLKVWATKNFIKDDDCFINEGDI